MAVILNGISGAVVGQVGQVVGYVWKNKHCLRSYRSKIAYPNTSLQQTQRDWFVSMVRFASKATPALKLGLRQVAEEAGMTEGNVFVRDNKSFFHSVLGSTKVDYNQLVIARGAAADVSFGFPHFEEGEIISVDFEKNSRFMRSSSDDSVYIYVYSPSLEAGILSAPVARRSKRVSLRLPQQWSGHEVHIYGFVIARDGQASHSTYIGQGRVDCYEDSGRYVRINQDWLDFVDTANRVNTVSFNNPTPVDAVNTLPQSHAVETPPGAIP